MSIPKFDGIQYREIAIYRCYITLCEHITTVLLRHFIASTPSI